MAAVVKAQAHQVAGALGRGGQADRVREPEGGGGRVMQAVGQGTAEEQAGQAITRYTRKEQGKVR